VVYASHSHLENACERYPASSSSPLWCVEIPRAFSVFFCDFLSMRWTSRWNCVSFFPFTDGGGRGLVRYRRPGFGGTEFVSSFENMSICLSPLSRRRRYVLPLPRFICFFDMRVRFRARSAISFPPTSHRSRFPCFFLVFPSPGAVIPSKVTKRTDLSPAPLSPHLVPFDSDHFPPAERPPRTFSPSETCIPVRAGATKLPGLPGRLPFEPSIRVSPSGYGRLGFSEKRGLSTIGPFFPLNVLVRPRSF